MESTGKIETDRLSNCSDTESTGSSEKGPVTLQTPASTEVAKLLECPVCYDIVLPPIVLCSGGHHVCNTCRPQLQTCPTCRGTFTNVRDRFAEEFLDQICSIRCKYASQGCTVSLPGRQLVEHQSKCNFRFVMNSKINGIYIFSSLCIMPLYLLNFLCVDPYFVGNVTKKFSGINFSSIYGSLKKLRHNGLLNVQLDSKLRKRKYLDLHV